jgi:sec-independent protein translocase protein TatA
MAHGLKWATVKVDVLAPEAFMGNLGFTEILLIGVALLIFFGPSKLPQLGKALGEGIQEFKKASKELTKAASEPEK